MATGYNLPEGVTESDLPGWEWTDDDENELQEQREAAAESEFRADSQVLRDYIGDHVDTGTLAGILCALLDGKPLQATADAARIRRDFVSYYVEWQ